MSEPTQEGQMLELSEQERSAISERVEAIKQAQAQLQGAVATIGHLHGLRGRLNLVDAGHILCIPESQ